MSKFIKILVVVIAIGGILWLTKDKFEPKISTISNHQILVKKIESMGKVELVKYRFSDVIEHGESSNYLPDAVSCIDLSKLQPQDFTVINDSVSIALPKAELCYVKIDHKASKVYDTKMAFFREALLVDEANKHA